MTAKEGPTGPFRVGERVLVPHTDKYYAAKAIKAEKRPDGLWYYLLHYQGWNKKWDEWVEAPGLVKYDSKLASKRTAEDDDGEPRKKRKGKKESAEPDSGEDDFSASPLKLELPMALKKVLIDDWERITKADKLLPLPRKPCVGDILTQYVELCKSKKDPPDAETEVANGLRIYFDKALKQILLYNQEQAQASKAMADGAQPSAVYGGEHLLRLLVKLPELLPLTNIPLEAYAALEIRLGEFVKFLQKNQNAFFLAPSAYQPAPNGTP